MDPQVHSGFAEIANVEAAPAAKAGKNTGRSRGRKGRESFGSFSFVSGDLRPARRPDRGRINCRRGRLAPNRSGRLRPGVGDGALRYAAARSLLFTFDALVDFFPV